MGAPDFRLRGTGRTTKLLDRVCEMLHCGQYDSMFYVTPNKQFIRYAAMLVQHHCQSSALFSETQNKLVFRNQYGKPVTIYFISMDNEPTQTRGYRNPIAHDHEVINRRSHPNVNERKVIDELISQGIDPWSEIHIYKS